MVKAARKKKSLTFIPVLNNFIMDKKTKKKKNRNWFRSIAIITSLKRKQPSELKFNLQSWKLLNLLNSGSKYIFNYISTFDWTRGIGDKKKILVKHGTV